MALSNGIYRIAFSRTNTLLTLDKGPNSGDIQPVTGRPDDQDPTGSAAQQWIVTASTESKSYTVLNSAYGLYLAPIYQDDPNSFLTGSPRPHHWALDVEAGTDTYSFFLKGTNRMLTLSSYSAVPGTKALLWPREASPEVSMRSWIFRKVEHPAAPKPAQPIVTLPAVRPGVYRIRNTGTSRSLLTQKKDIAPNGKYPLVVGLAYQSDNDYQIWEITLHASSQTYFIKNRGSGTWLGTVDYADSWNDLAGVPDAGKLHWDIRQGEYEGQFIFHLPGISWTADLENGSALPNTRVVTFHKFNQPTVNYQTWWLDPVDQPSTAVTRRPPITYLAPLKTGVYFIRNSASRTLLTQAQTIANDLADYYDPVVVGSPFESDSKFQLWRVSYIPDIQAYTVQNVGSGRYLATLYGSVDAAVVIASEIARPWSIRQAEAASEFLFHLVSSQLIITLLGASALPNTKTYLTSKAGQPTVTYQRWIFESADGTSSSLGDPNPAGWSGSPSAVSAQAYINSKPVAAFHNGARLNGIRNVLTATALEHREGNTPPVVGGQSINATATGQEWIVTPTDIPGQYTLLNPITQQYLTYPDPASDGTQPIVTETPKRWDIRVDGNQPAYLITIPGSGLALNLSKQDDGTPVTLKYVSGVDREKWTFEIQLPS